MLLIYFIILLIYFIILLIDFITLLICYILLLIYIMMLLIVKIKLSLAYYVIIKDQLYSNYKQYQLSIIFLIRNS